MEEEKNNLGKAIKELMRLEGQMRGTVLKGELAFILKKEGKEGLRRLEERAREFGWLIDYQGLKTMEFYPIWYEPVTYLLMQDVFGFKDEDFVQLGIFESKLPLFVRMFMVPFYSFGSVIKEAPKIWRKYYTVGDLEITELSKKDREAVMTLKNFKLHPLYCRALEGFLAGLLKLLVAKKIVSRETKCPFQGDDYHEFLFKW